MSGLTVWLPLPPKALSPNQRSHWAVKAQMVKEYRSLAWLLTRSAITDSRWKQPEGVAEVRLRFNNRRVPGDGCYRPRDEDNAIASIKSLLDGMTDAGVWKDDSRKHMTIAGVEIVNDKTSEAGVTVEVRA